MLQQLRVVPQNDEVLSLFIKEARLFLIIEKDISEIGNSIYKKYKSEERRI